MGLTMRPRPMASIGVATEVEAGAVSGMAFVGF